MKLALSNLRQLSREILNRFQRATTACMLCLDGDTGRERTLVKHGNMLIVMPYLETQQKIVL